MVRHRVDLRAAIAPVAPAAAADRVCVAVTYGRLVLDELVLPLCGELSSRDVARAIWDHWGFGGAFRGQLPQGSLAVARELPWCLWRAISLARDRRLYLHPRALARALGLAVARGLCAGALAAPLRASNDSGVDCPADAALLIERCRIAQSSEDGKYDRPATSLRPDGDATGLRHSDRPAARSRPDETSHIPILMYHRVTDSPAPGFQRWAVPVDEFEHQLRFLRWLGCYSVSSMELLAAIRHGQRLPGRPVLLTFDDGYCDFADTAAPLLSRYGFGGEVFIVTGKVGGTADWDARDGKAAPLMTWPQIKALRQAGVSFGSHLATHRRAADLSTEELIQEGAASRFELEARTGDRTVSIAMPHGSHDTRVISALRWCGYEIGYTTKSGPASIHMNAMTLPRIEVCGDEALEVFAANIGRRHELDTWRTREVRTLTAPTAEAAGEVRS